jgi:NADH:ubiquinone oxidoreductase subunit B-like Fe-S oxidoreductase
MNRVRFGALAAVQVFVSTWNQAAPRWVVTFIACSLSLGVYAKNLVGVTPKWRLNMAANALGLA